MVRSQLYSRDFPVDIFCSLFEEPTVKFVAAEEISKVSKNGTSPGFEDRGPDVSAKWKW